MWNKKKSLPRTLQYWRIPANVTDIAAGFVIFAVSGMGWRLCLKFFRVETNKESRPSGRGSRGTGEVRDNITTTTVYETRSFIVVC